jgi:Fe(3+) dicitrate transport protein
MLLTMLLGPTAEAQEGLSLDEVTVQEEAMGSILPKVEEGKLYEGKKVTRTVLSRRPEITTNNFRQILSQTPGVLTSEVGNESFTSINYRGIGDPHESFNTLMVQDGIPISVDPFGYAAAYYTPPIESVEHADFIKGGSSLLYGPLPGGALSFELRQPSLKGGTRFTTKQVVGSRGLYSTFNEVATSLDSVGILGSFHHRESDGFRVRNSDYSISNGHLAALVRFSPETYGVLSLDAYNNDSGEAGGLALTETPGAISLGQDRNATLRPFDRLRIERYSPSLKVVHSIDDDTTFTQHLWGTYVRRSSRRQSQGDAPAFGGIPLGTGNTIAIQEFATVGSISRLTIDHALFGVKSTTTAGVTLMGIDSPFTEQKGETPYADAGPTSRLIDRSTFAAAFSLENAFFISDSLSITPGFRLETIHQEIEEQRTSDLTVGLRSDSSSVAVPLFGLGAEYRLHPTVTAYANVSQSYRPVTYQDAVPLGPGDTISRDLDPTHAVTSEVGFKGKATEWFTWDTSAFSVHFTDQVGRVGTAIQNVGNSHHYGAEGSIDISLTTLLDDTIKSDLDKNFGSLSITSNASLLRAHFYTGPLDGKTPQYAPRSLIKSGLNYRKNGTKVSLLSTFVSSHFGDDSNSVEREIPSYKVWDLTTDLEVAKGLSLTGGVNNLFNEKYYSRVRGNGIDPALPRNWYGGIRISF